MIDDSEVKSVRLTKEDAKLFTSNLVKEAIEEKKKKTKILTKKQKINKVVINGFYVILGMFFFMTLGPQTNIVSIAIIAGMGILFTLVGAFNLYFTMKEDDIFVRKKK